MRESLKLSGITWFAAITLALCASAANAAIYQWKDAAGHTIFSATPPPNAQSTIVNPKAGKASSEAIRKLKTATAPATPKAAAAEKKKPDTPPEPTAAEKKANCQKARGILTQLQNSARLQDYDEKTKQRRFLTTDERQQRMKASELSIKSWCKK